MRVFAKLMEANGNIYSVEIEQDLGVEIRHNKNRYTLNISNDGELILRSIENTSIVIIPQASNSVKVESQ